MQLTPWMISESFIKGYLEKGGDGLLRLHGLGDPSGIGEGFSLLRLVTSSSSTNHNFFFFRPSRSSAKKYEANIYNTTGDLRKLSIQELDDILAPHYTAEQLISITRWKKASLVRSLGNKAQNCGVAQELHKYCRHFFFSSLL